MEYRHWGAISMLIPSDEDPIEEIERVVEKFLRTHADKYQTTAQARWSARLEAEASREPVNST
jgi:hypothetical protein